MDVKDITSRLQALQKLYGLLVTNAGGTPITPSDILDENARSVLKNLLDEATQKVLSANAELIAGRMGTLVSQADYIEQPIKNMDAPGYRKKRCRVCKKSTDKQLKFVEDTNSEDFAQDSVSAINFQSEKRDGTDSFVRNSDLEPGPLVVEKTLQHVDDGRGIMVATGDMRDFGYTSLNRVVDCDQSSEVGCISNEASEEIKRIKSCISALQYGQLRKCCDEHKPVQNVSQNRGPNVKAIIEKMESIKWKTNNEKLMLRSPPNFSSANEERFKDTRKKVYEHARFMPKEFSDSASYHVYPTRDHHRKLYPSGRRDKVVLNNKRRSMTTPMTPLRQQKSKTIGSVGSYSSSGISYSEEYSSSDSARKGRNGTGSRMSSYSGTTSTMSSESPYEYGRTMYSDSGSYEAQQSNTSSVSETEMSSSYSESCAMDPSLVRTGTMKKKGSQPSTLKPKKGGGGTLKKLKDRLAIIFHQHHHHHHHHGKEDEHHKPKSFVSSREADDYGKKAVHTMQKTGNHWKKHQSQFGGLMGAVFRHVRRSKKSKSKENDSKPNRKMKKKSQWANLTKKAHIKLGVGKPKSRLKALPKIK